MMNTRETGGKEVKCAKASESEYDYDDGANECSEVPEVRIRMDKANAGAAESMPELQTAEVGSIEPLGKTGQIYFLETEDGQFVKIGFSGRIHVHSRLSELGTLRPTPFAFRIIGSIPASPQVERWLHQLFAEDCDNGEWFRSTPRLRAFIDMLQLTPVIERRPRTRRSQRKDSRALIVHVDSDPEPAQTDPTLEISQRSEPPIEAMAKKRKLPEEALVFFRKQGRKGGKAGAKARMQKLTPEQRSEIARKAGLAGGRGRKKAQ